MDQDWPGKRKIIFTIDESSVIAKAGKGYPQGGVLSPLLWATLVTDLIITSSKKGFQCLGYADDTSIFIRSRFAGVISEQT